MSPNPPPATSRTRAWILVAAVATCVAVLAPRHSIAPPGPPASHDGIAADDPEPPSAPQEPPPSFDEIAQHTVALRLAGGPRPPGMEVDVAPAEIAPVIESLPRVGGAGNAGEATMSRWTPDALARSPAGCVEEFECGDAARRNFYPTSAPELLGQVYSPRMAPLYTIDITRLTSADAIASGPGDGIEIPDGED